jgi:hypothetical protein
MEIAVHPRYSPNLAPSGFHLLGHVKCLLSGESSETGERLLSAVEGILGSLENAILTKAFLEGMKRLERCIEVDGDDVGYGQINILGMLGFKR